MFACFLEKNLSAVRQRLEDGLPDSQVAAEANDDAASAIMNDLTWIWRNLACRGAVGLRRAKGRGWTLSTSFCTRSNSSRCSKATAQPQRQESNTTPQKITYPINRSIQHAGRPGTARMSNCMCTFHRKQKSRSFTLVRGRHCLQANIVQDLVRNTFAQWRNRDRAFIHNLLTPYKLLPMNWLSPFIRHIPGLCIVRQ